MQVRFCSLSSGSSGNSQYIETENTKILIDAGLTGKNLDSLLRGIGVNPHELDAIFITHEHCDHASGAGIISRKYDIPIFANDQTWEALLPVVKKIKPEHMKIFDVEKSFLFKDFWITPVPLFHDSVFANGYVIQTEKTKLSIITDTGWISTDMKNLMKDSQLYYIESNYDVDMLKNGYYPWVLKQRILSTRGHLSNENCAEVMGELAVGNREIVMLSHLSQDNNTPTLAFDAVKNKFDELRYALDEDVILKVSPRFEPSDVFTL